MNRLDLLIEGTANPIAACRMASLLRQLLSVAVLSIIMALPLAVNAAISDIDKAAKQNFKAAKHPKNSP
jgi:hypothetical protein